MGRKKPHVIITIDGVGALGFMPFSMKYALMAAGNRYEVRNFVWTHGFGRMLADLQDWKHITQKAEALAATIRELIPEQSVSVVAHSGGAIVALEALKHLAADAVDTVVLLAPAVSPKYDLARVIASVKNKIYSVNSIKDNIMLGLCTSIFGTADGVRTKAAGCVGFNLQCDKLEQIEWTHEMKAALHFGGHAGFSMLPFLRQYILPLLPDISEKSTKAA